MMGCWSGGGINSGFAKAVKSKKHLWTPRFTGTWWTQKTTDTFQRTRHSYREKARLRSTRRNEYPERLPWQRLQHRFVLSIRGNRKANKRCYSWQFEDTALNLFSMKTAWHYFLLFNRNWSLSSILLSKMLCHITLILRKKIDIYIWNINTFPDLLINIFTSIILTIVFIQKL